MDMTPDELRDAAARYAEQAGLERVRRYLANRKPLPPLTDTIDVVYDDRDDPMELLLSDLIAVVAMAGRT